VSGAAEDLTFFTLIAGSLLQFGSPCSIYGLLYVTGQRQLVGRTHKFALELMAQDFLTIRPGLAPKISIGAVNPFFCALYTMLPNRRYSAFRITTFFLAFYWLIAALINQVILVI